MKAMEGSAKHFLESLLTSDIQKTARPTQIQRVHCPTCGSYAERHHEANAIRTECSHCDYLMTICAQTGRVIEAYSPSFSPATLAAAAIAA